jgi:aldose 1-epimerase
VVKIEIGIMRAVKQKVGNVNGEDVFSVELCSQDLKISISTFGATITSAYMPDNAGRISNVVLSYKSLEEYVSDPLYIGCTIGRFAGRISKGRFKIDNNIYQLAQNEVESGNHLHGGITGFNKKIFTVINYDYTASYAKVKMHYKSDNLDQGYPGNLDLWISFELNDNNQLTIYYEAETDEPTHVNLTNHSYFNLSQCSGNALGQELFIKADQYLVSDDTYLPTGEIKQVHGTIVDFNSSKKISEIVGQNPSICNVYYVLNKDKQLPSAILSDKQTGRSMEVRTSLPCLVFYSGDYPTGPFSKNAGVCLETQFFPDTPNRPEFPSTLLRPGEKYDHYTSYKFNW